MILHSIGNKMYCMLWIVSNTVGAEIVGVSEMFMT